MAKTRDDLISMLTELDIAHSTRDHEPLYTVAQSQALRGQIAGRHTKNLFLKDKKDNFFLVTVGEDAEVDLKTIHTLIGGASKVSFGNAERLEEFLGVMPGAVTALGVVNDTGGRVKAVLDEELMDHAIVNCHPLVNTATTSLSPADLVKFMRATGHDPLVLKVSRQEPHDGQTPQGNDDEQR
ncbi:MAG: YbaK/EbsC family protein [Mesorhizobium sp.]